MSHSVRVEGHGEVALEQSSAISGADPGAEDEGVTVVESGGWLMTIEAYKGSTRQPTKGSTRGIRLWPRRDRELEGDTHALTV
jgi:hypothetical protein